MKGKHRTIELTPDLDTRVEPPIASAERSGRDREHTAVRFGSRRPTRRKSPELGGRQTMILEFIRDFVGRNPFPPTVREIGKGCHISSTSVVDYNLAVLEVQGYLTRIPNIARGIILTERSRDQSGNHQGCQ